MKPVRVQGAGATGWFLPAGISKGSRDTGTVPEVAASRASRQGEEEDEAPRAVSSAALPSHGASKTQVCKAPCLPTCSHPSPSPEAVGRHWQTSQSAFQKGMGLKGHSMGRRWGEMAGVRETCSIKRKKEKKNKAKKHKYGS